MNTSLQKQIFGCILGLCGSVGADMTRSWDWKPSDNGSSAPKRTLTIVFHPSVDNFTQQTGVDLRKAVQAAADNWSAVKTDTGWDFKVDDNSSTGDIVIKAENPPPNDKPPNGGATASTTTDSNGRVTQYTVTFDITPQGFKRDKNGRMVRDPDIGTFLVEDWTWGGPAGLNPVTTAMHEITHAARKKHERNDNGEVKANTGDLTNPVSPGNNQTTPSQHDKENMKASCDASIYNVSWPMTPTGGFICLPGPPESGAPGGCLNILPGALAFPAEITLTPIEDRSIPFPDQLWPDLGRISVGVRIESSDPGMMFLIPAHVTIFYDNGAFNDPTYGKTDEAGLQVFSYDPILETWTPLGPAEINPRGDFAGFSVPGPGIYGLAGPFDSASEIRVSIHGTVIPANFTGDFASLAARFVFMQGGITVATERVMLNPDGSFTVSEPVPRGIYDVSIKVEPFLQKVLRNVPLLDLINPLGALELTNGDLDGDNTVTSGDLAVVIASLDQVGEW